MNLEPLLETINDQLIECQKRPLNPTEVLIMRGIWQFRTYNQMAIDAGYSPAYFTNVVAPELFGRLSNTIGQRINKKNCRGILESYFTHKAKRGATYSMQSSAANFSADVDHDTSPPYPSGSVPLNSPFYVERSPVEEQVCQEIRKPGALVRIKAPREMGKTSMLLRVLDHGDREGYSTICLNLEQVEQGILSNLNQFLRWLCANVARQLQRKPMLEEYWDDDLGSKMSCTLYFQEYLLEAIDTPLILALDEVNQIFEHPQVAKDFLGLLRSCYEEAKRLPIWQKLRLLVVHSTEIYVPLELDQSPFNVGLPIQLNSFSQAEVQQLAKLYKLDWKDGEEARQLMAMVGGHPGLVNLALYYLNRKDVTLSQLLKTAPTGTGIYANHLQHHWATLEKQPELAKALDAVLNATQPVVLDPIVTHKLSSMGLIKQSGNRAIAGCELYRRYFTRKRG